MFASIKSFYANHKAAIIGTATVVTGVVAAIVIVKTGKGAQALSMFKTSSMVAGEAAVIGAEVIGETAAAIADVGSEAVQAVVSAV